ncbi:hypothetical protein B0H19DRAFT_1255957 [Mycena capillaripes]|nr:hypothetical protein B0H19DRAFT_1255957 [Mycena capillaripes]
MSSPSSAPRGLSSPLQLQTSAPPPLMLIITSSRKFFRLSLRPTEIPHRILPVDPNSPISAPFGPNFLPPAYINWTSSLESYENTTSFPFIPGILFSSSTLTPLLQNAVHSTATSTSTSPAPTFSVVLSSVFILPPLEASPPLPRIHPETLFRSDNQTVAVVIDASSGQGSWLGSLKAICSVGLGILGVALYCCFYKRREVPEGLVPMTNFALQPLAEEAPDLPGPGMAPLIIFPNELDAPHARPLPVLTAPSPPPPTPSSRARLASPPPPGLSSQSRHSPRATPLNTDTSLISVSELGPLAKQVDDDAPTAAGTDDTLTLQRLEDDAVAGNSSIGRRNETRNTEEKASVCSDQENVPPVPGQLPLRAGSSSQDGEHQAQTGDEVETGVLRSIPGTKALWASVASEGPLRKQERAALGEAVKQVCAHPGGPRAAERREIVRHYRSRIPLAVSRATAANGGSG